MRIVLVASGFAAMGLGIAGLVLPVLPTTPFMLVAAACFARSSPRFHRWLLEHRVFGPIVSEWERHRAIAWKTKLWAIALMSGTLAASIVFFVKPTWLRLALALFGLFLAAWLYRIPSRDRPPRR
ncbi:MAG TPA: YbaN family protein [Usitatibacteraceae bacterium]|nr:YbaN family protein [Usitatibacteraceae bacterium]